MSRLVVFNGLERRGFIGHTCGFSLWFTESCRGYRFCDSLSRSLSRALALRALKWLYSKLLMRQGRCHGPALPHGPEPGFVCEAGVSVQVALVHGSLCSPGRAMVKAAGCNPINSPPGGLG